MHPKELMIKDFSYELPEERIAKYPLAERHLSKLLVFDQGNITTDTYLNLAEHLPENTLLVFNNTKVVEARLLFQKPTGGVIEIFCLEPDDRYPDITTAMLQKGKVYWKCLIGGAKKWKEPQLIKTIQLDKHSIELSARRLEQQADYYVIEFCWTDPGMSFAELLHQAGLIPLPPYLNRTAELADKDRYQTIYAKYDGSVAAPTAGLHFTDQVFARLKEKYITHAFVTLHVGAGTFKPVKSENIAGHEMHAEFIEVSLDFIKALIHHIPRTVVPVGTTSLRTLESLYWLGVKTILHPGIQLPELTISQWDPYTLNFPKTTATEALRALENWMQKNAIKKLITKTQIIIAPGYQYQIADGLITNFHQPQSTLLLLVAAMIGEEWKTMYQYAMDHDFRFLSYGDGCLIWKKKIQN